MIVLRNILKVVATIIVGYIVGFILGSILGALFGMFISFFIQDIAPQQAASFSILISIIMGGLFSLLVSQILNVVFETNLNPLLGAIPGALIGILLIVFVDEYFEVSSLNNYYGSRVAQSWMVTSIMPYCSTIGRQVGTIIFPLFGAVWTLREIIQSHLELQRNRELMKDWPPSHWGLPEISPKAPSLQPGRLTSPLLFQSSLKISAKGQVFLSVLKTFAFACAIGVILSVVGWQTLGWSSSAQFSKGLFWASAMVAIYGYFNKLGVHRTNYRNSSTRYGETVGDMNMEERTRQWATQTGGSLEPLPKIFLVSVCLLGFSVLVSIIF